jgi:signal transduction histidine kinase
MAVIARFSENSQWLLQTYELQVATGKVESAISEAARARLNYINLRDQSFLPPYKTAIANATENLRLVHRLTPENAALQSVVKELDASADRRVDLMSTSVDLRATGAADDARQSEITLENTKAATVLAAVVDKMQQQEESILVSRKNEASRLFATVLWILGAMLASALFLFWVHYHLLNRELEKRERAEGGARRLSAHVLQLQDEERRKFSRELHDGIGQNLAAAKMIACSLSDKYPGEHLLRDLLSALDQAIMETRTISHLLHPLLLDELGLASAVSWYVDGFSKRSGIQVSTNISESVGRLGRPQELVLFRVLQESLTNVHRHAKSQKAEISLHTSNGNAILQVRDHGIGMPFEKLKQFRSDGTQVGVGLTGMRERVREHGGTFEINSDGKGTEVSVSIPAEPVAHAHDGEPVASAAG